MMSLRRTTLSLLLLFQTSPLASSFGGLRIGPSRLFSTRTTLLPDCSASLLNSPRRRSLAMAARPKRGSVVDSYQTVSVKCAKCGERLFRYKKKNGTKSNLIKCFVERIAEDSAGVLQTQGREATEYKCPSCQTRFARLATIRGLPALKLVGGKVRMTKK